MLAKEFITWIDIFNNYQPKVSVYSSFFSNKLNINTVREIKSLADSIKIVIHNLNFLHSSEIKSAR